MKKILIIDDDQDFIDLYTKVLSERFSVYAVTNLKACLEYLKLNPFEIDLILCDVFMPEINGFELHDFLASREEFSFYPFVFKTSSLNQEVINKSIIEKETEVINTMMSNFEITSRIERELKKSPIIKIFRGSKYKLVYSTLTKEVLWPKDVYQINFTENESKVLSLLKDENSVLSKEEVIDSLFGENYFITDNNFNTFLSNLRKKLTPFNINIKSIRNKGLFIC